MNIQTIANETTLLNYQFLNLVRTTLNSNPELLPKVLGVDLETAEAISELDPEMLNNISRNNVLYFSPRINSKIFQDLIQAAKSKDQVEMDCVTQHIIALVD